MDLPEVYDTLPAFDLTADLPLDPPEPGMVAIYALCDPRDGAIRYIGKTDNCRRRLRRHYDVQPLAARRHKERWVTLLRSLGLRPAMKVMAWVVPCDADQSERAAIAAARAARYSLTNLTDGGDGNHGRPASPRSVAHLIAYNKESHPEKYVKGQQTRKVRGLSPKQRAAASTQMRTLVGRRAEWEQARLQGLCSDQTRAKMSASQKRWLEDPTHAAQLEERWARAQQAAWTPETRAKRSDLLRQRWANPEFRAKMSQIMNAVRAAAPPRAISDETRLKLSAARKGKPASDETKARLCVAQQARRARERSTPEGRAQLSASADKTWTARRANESKESGV